MSNALLSSVSSALNLSARQEIAKILGEPEPAGNLQLSQDRANNVTAELVKLDVDRNRPLAKG